MFFFGFSQEKSIKQHFSMIFLRLSMDFPFFLRIFLGSSMDFLEMFHFSKALRHRSWHTSTSAIHLASRLRGGDLMKP